MIIENSKVNAIGNGANGIHIGTEGKIEKGSRVTVSNNECKIGSKWTKPGAVYVGKSLDVSDEDVKLEIVGNKNCGVYVKREARAIIKMGVIKTNINDVELVHDSNGTEVQNARTGGGIFNDGGTVFLGEKVQLYNNHAAIAGDDIFNAEGATITFGPTGSGWKLDGEPDCTDDITGWFDDSENNRWNAHGEGSLHIDEFTPAENGVSEEKALKAAHGKISPVIPPYIPPATHYYTVTYNDGVEGEVVFPDQINRGLSYYTLTPAFNGATTSYSAVVSNSISSISVSATAVGSNSTISGTGSYSLAVGNNTIKINCKSQSGDTRTYTITVARQAAPASGGNNNNTNTSTDVNISSSSYKIGTYITGVSPDTTAQTFIKNISVSASGSIKILTAAGAENTGKVGTGNKVAVYDASGNLKKTYEVVIYGDVNGDGSINALDMIKLNRHILGKGTLSGSYLQAADANRKNDGGNALDMIIMNRHILGKTKISQN